MFFCGCLLFGVLPNSKVDDGKVKKRHYLLPPLLLHLHRILHQRHFMRHHRIIPRTPALPALGNTAAAPTVISIGVLGGLVQGFDF